MYNKEFKEELDLLYRLRFERGLIPNPERFKFEETKEIAQSIRYLSEALEDIDAQLITLYKEAIETKE